MFESLTNDDFFVHIICENVQKLEVRTCYIDGLTFITYYFNKL